MEDDSDNVGDDDGEIDAKWVDQVIAMDDDRDNVVVLPSFARQE